MNLPVVPAKGNQVHYYYLSYRKANSPKMKYSLILPLFFALAFNLNAQKKFSAALELSAGISESTQPGFNSFRNEGVQLGRNAFLKGGYRVTNNLKLTLGLGFMNIQAMEYVFLGSDDIDFTQTLLSHQYVTIPAGFEYHFGSFYLNPEIGIAIGQSHLVNQSIYFIQDNFAQISSAGGSSPDFVYNKITVPIFLNFGTEFDVRPVKIIFGIKAYYSLNKISDILTFSRNYYGVGVMTGVKF